MSGYTVSEYRMKPPNWYVHYAGALDGSGLPKIAAGPFASEVKAAAWVDGQVEWERSPDNSARWD